MSFPPYASYKDSGVRWLGEVPIHWDVKRLRFIAALNPSKNEVAELPDEVELSFIPMEAVGEEGELDLSRTRPLGEVRNGYSYFADGDVVFAKVTPCLENGKGALMRDLVGAKGFGTTELTVLRPASPEDGRFLWWLTKAAEFRGPASGEMVGAGGLKRVPDQFVANFAAPWPPAQDRQSIADLLDRETAKIDALVEAQRGLIALLKEKRQAVISYAVTKGLDPSAPLKPSGIDWLGDVPAHWEVRPLRAVSTEPGTVFIDGDWIEAKDISDDGIRYITTGNVGEGFYKQQGAGFISAETFKELNCTEVLPGDVLVSRLNAPIGRACIVPHLHTRIVTSVDNVIVRPDKAVHRPFLVYFLSTDYYFYHTNTLARGTTMQRVSRTILGNIRIAMPAIDDQRKIADYISRETTKLDTLIEGAERGITLLQERRTALISAAVTGKIDVRGWSAEEVRNAVGAEIIHLHARDRTFGRVQNQKLLFLAQIHAGVAEIAGRFQRQAAGPHDAELMSSMEQVLKAEGVLQVSQLGGSGSQVTYTVTPGTRRDRLRLRAMLGTERLAKLDHLLRALADLDTRGVEAVATLYGVWNDALLDGETPDDDRLVRGFLKEWHPEKAEKFSSTEVRNWIGFMRRNDLVPEGRGARTQVGALL